jgi:hypothetical protein
VESEKSELFDDESVLEDDDYSLEPYSPTIIDEKVYIPMSKRIECKLPVPVNIEGMEFRSELKILNKKKVKNVKLEKIRNRGWEKI